MQFKLGDKVSFLNEKLDGVVTKIISTKQVEVTTSDGFGIPVLNKELVLVERKETESIAKPIKIEEPTPEQKTPEPLFDEDSDKFIGRKHIQKVIREKMGTKVVGKISLKHSHRRKDVEDEIDLHIENLIDSWKNLSNGEIVNIQLAAARKKLDWSILNGKHRLLIIHGVGNGTLKSEVRKLINSYPGIRCEDGSFGLYGVGATMVHL